LAEISNQTDSVKANYAITANILGNNLKDLSVKPPHYSACLQQIQNEILSSVTEKTK
jgi:hypothetical protein